MSKVDTIATVDSLSFSNTKHKLCGLLIVSAMSDCCHLCLHEVCNNGRATEQSGGFTSGRSHGGGVTGRHSPRGGSGQIEVSAAPARLPKNANKTIKPQYIKTRLIKSESVRNIAALLDGLKKTYGGMPTKATKKRKVRQSVPINLCHEDASGGNRLGNLC